jgi:hypothetical protein
MSSALDGTRSERVRSPAQVRLRQPLRAATPAEQRTARIMGAWFLGTFVFSIPAFWFYDPLLDHAGYVLGTGHDTRVAIGALLEICLAVSGIATAVVIFPIVKRVNERQLLGTSRRAPWSRS